VAAVVAQTAATDLAGVVLEGIVLLYKANHQVVERPLKAFLQPRTELLTP
jgi:hypothetical protein